jgi:phosphoglycolate phosphatase-like HAD superfamily hydrolase
MRGVIFDVDGTLVDSNDAHAESWVDAFREHGYDIPYYRIRPLIGMGGDRLIYALASVEPDSPEAESMVNARENIFLRDYLHKVKAFDGAGELLVRMRERALELAVASSSEGEILERLLALTGASHLLEPRAGFSRAEASKPAPDPVLSALDLLGVSATETLMVGDTPYDRTAARRAGVDFVGLRCGGWSDRDLTGAIAIYDHPADLLRRFEESPFADRALWQRLERRSDP